MQTLSTEKRVTTLPDGTQVNVVTAEMDQALSSVELKEDAKGVTHPVVKVYHTDPYVAAKIATNLMRSFGAEVTFDESELKEV